ncbi:MAG: CBS domain-containing protein, partial [Nitrososphaerales archaeon]
LRAVAISTAEETAKKDHLTISGRETVSKLISMFQDTHYYEAIVVDGRTPQSVVTVRDILKVVHPERTSVASISFSPPRTSPSTRIYDVATTLVRNRRGEKLDVEKRNQPPSSSRA